MLEKDLGEISAVIRKKCFGLKQIYSHTIKYEQLNHFT